MSSEGILPQLSVCFIQVRSTVKEQDSLSVYTGSYEGYKATIEVQKLLQPASQTHLGTMFQTLQNLSHPNIMLLYDSFEAFSDSAYFFVVVSKWYPKDLAKDIVNRLTNSFRWKEDEMWGIARKLIEVFARLQCIEIAHRNIKPANIYLSADNEPKVAGFSYATFGDRYWTKVTGTLNYLSPKLKAALQNGGSVNHNAFKSDVYSLGVTLYELASLDIQMTLQNTADVGMEVDRIPYSEDLKGLLKMMLIADEDQRPDFIYLYNQISPGSPLVAVRPQYTASCIYCQNEVPIDLQFAVRLSCDSAAHVFCSLNCFQTWCSIQTLWPLYCPICRTEIPQQYMEPFNPVAQSDRNAVEVDAQQKPLVEIQAQVSNIESVVNVEVESSLIDSRRNDKEEPPAVPRPQRRCWEKLCGCFTSTK